MKGFDARFIEEVKNKNDIVSVIGKYVRLQQRGKSFWGCCPFHHEKTPSFCVNSVEQFYHCFGCHKSGDVITFIQEMESLDFADAVKFLAEKSGIHLPEVEYDSEIIKEQKLKKEKLYDLLRDTAVFYVNNLRTERAKAHRDYLIKREITGEYINKFGIGASTDFNSLPKYLSGKGYTFDDMVLAGVVSKSEKGYFDALGGRLIVPIINQFNQVIAFGGRLLEKADFGKYKNTKDTPVFNKSKTLYNLNLVKKIKNETGLKSLIMVEGYMDTISLVSAGFNNVVASMGTSLTKEQARMVKRYVDKVYVSYDGDSAGQNATIRGLEIFKDEGLEVYVVSLPDGLDPDDVIKKRGADSYKKLLDEAKPLIDFKLELVERNYDLSSTDGKRKYVSGAIKIIKESPSPVEQEDLLKRVQKVAGFSLDALKRELYSIEEVKRETVAPQLNIVSQEGDKISVACRFVLFSYLFNKEYAFLQDINELDFFNKTHVRIKNYISTKLSEGGKIRFTDLFELLPDEEINELSFISNNDTEDNTKFDKEQFFKDSVLSIKRYSIEQRINELKNSFIQEQDTRIKKEITGEITKLLAEKSKLK